jgi:hypothetical protein
VTGYGNSAGREAAAIRARARRGVWRRLTAAVGANPAAVRADAQAALWDRGAQGETATARMLAQLQAHGWQIRHDLRLRGRRFNLDHVLVSPCGTAVVVLDTKVWHRGRPTTVRAGRVCCGAQDRHEQVVKVAGYAAAVQKALGLPGVVVWPLLVVHNSPVQGGVLAVRAPEAGWAGPVYVLSPPYLVPTLAQAPKQRDPGRTAAVTARVNTVLRPYTEGR